MIIRRKISCSRERDSVIDKYYSSQKVKLLRKKTGLFFKFGKLAVRENMTVKVVTGRCTVPFITPGLLISNFFTISFIKALPPLDSYQI